jgi:hypothetical protein
MYPWHATTPPVASFDGQIYADDKKQVWRWNATVGAWLRAEQMYLKETARLWIESRGYPVAPVPLITRMFNGRVRNQWDSFWNLAFVELRTANSAQVLYQAQMTLSELQSWVYSALSQSGGNYDENAELIVYEAVDPEIRCSRMQTWNLVYSTARGKSAYNRRYGRDKAGMPDWWKSDRYWRGDGVRFWSDAFTEPGRDFMQAFHGIATPSDPDTSDGLIWFHSDHRNLYHHPKVGSGLSILNGRTVYNAVSGAYETAPVPPVTSLGFTIGAPRVFYRFGGGNNRFLNSASELRGTNLVKDRMNGVMVYPLVSNGAPLRYAFYVKPIGVDYVSTSINSAGVDQIVCLAHYGDSVESQRRAPTGEWNAEFENSFRFNLFDALPEADSGIKSGLDNACTVRRMQFYARNTQTGVITEPFDTEIHNVRRKANISMSFEPRRLQR